MAEVESEARSAQDIAPEAVQLFLAGLVIANEQLLSPDDSTQLLDVIAQESQNALSHEELLDPRLREQLQWILEEFQKARHLVRVQLRDPPTDLMT